MKKIKDLTESAMLVSLSVRGWSGHTTDQEVSHEVSVAHNSEESLGRYRKRLLPKEATMKLGGAYQSIRNEHYRLTLPWGDDGYRILSADGYFEYNRQISEWKLKIDQLLADFWPMYDRYKADMQSRLNGLYKESDYPTVEELKDKYKIVLLFKPLPQKDDFRVNSLDKQDLDAIKKSIEVQGQKTLEEAMKNAYSRLNSVIEKALEKLKNYKVENEKVEGRFRDSLIGNIQEMVDLVPILNITKDHKLDAFAEKIRKEILVYTPQVLRDDDAARAKAIASTEAIMAKMKGYL